MPTYVVFLGPPGSGKGTQAKLAAEKFGLPAISTGDLFRALRTQESEFARKIGQILDSGGLVPDEDTIELVKDRLSERDCARGAILDGFPRTLPQARALDTLLETTFHTKVARVPVFEVSREETIRRIAKRAEQEKRGDEAKAEERYEVYRKETEPLIAYYEAQGLAVAVDASKAIEEVGEQLMPLIEEKVSKA